MSNIKAIDSLFEKNLGFLKWKSRVFAKKHELDRERVENIFTRFAKSGVANLSVFNIKSNNKIDIQRYKFEFEDLTGDIENCFERAIEISGANIALLEFEKEDYWDLLCKIGFVVNIDDVYGQPLCTLEELAHLTREFVKHLERNFEQLVNIGLAKTDFKQSPWLNNMLTKLYFVKIPVTYNSHYNLDKRFKSNKRDEPQKDAFGNEIYNYVWAKETADFHYEFKRYMQKIMGIKDLPIQIGMVYPWCNGMYCICKDGKPVTFCEYEEASLLPFLSKRKARRLENLREKVFDVKIKVLNRLIVALEQKTINNLWEDSLNILTDSFSYQEIGFLLNMDMAYLHAGFGGKIIFIKSRKGTGAIVAYGGLRELLGVIGFYENEIANKKCDTTKKALDNIPAFSNYYESFGKPWKEEIDPIIKHYYALHDQEEKFFNEYEKRVNEALQNEFYQDVYLKKKVKTKLINNFEPQMIYFANYLNQALESGTSWGVNLGKPIQQPRKRSKRRRQRKRLPLTKRQKEAYTFVNIQGKTPGEAAIEMGCSRQNVYKHLKKAEEKVKAMNSNSRSVNFRNMQALPTDNRDQSAISGRDSRAKNSPHLTKKSTF